MFHPTAAEIKKLDKILHNRFGGVEPNLYIAVYKNRGGKHNAVKIWLKVDYSTMRVSDLFCTDYNYRLLDKQDLPETFVTVNENGSVNTVTFKEDIPVFNGMGASNYIATPTKYEAIYAGENGEYEDPAEQAIKQAMKDGSVESVMSRKLRNRIEREDIQKEQETADIGEDGWPIEENNDSSNSEEDE